MIKTHTQYAKLQCTARMLARRTGISPDDYAQEAVLTALENQARGRQYSNTIVLRVARHNVLQGIHSFRRQKIEGEIKLALREYGGEVGSIALDKAQARASEDIPNKTQREGERLELLRLARRVFELPTRCVLRHLLMGETSKEIAQSLGIAEHEVLSHKSRIYHAARRIHKAGVEGYLARYNSTIDQQHTAYGRTQSLRAWAAEAGIDYQLVYQRLSRGLQGEEVVSSIKSKGGTPKDHFQAIEIDGRVQSATQWAKEVGISPDCLRWRWNKGLRGADLIAPPRKRRKGKK